MPVAASIAALALLSGSATEQGLPPERQAPAGSSDWYEDTAAEHLRQDQCLMADVLRLGGSKMAATAQDALNQPQERLRELADRDHWEETPLAQAYTTDRGAAGAELDALHALRDKWGKPLAGLETPGGFSVTGFYWPPGASEGEDFYQQTGLTKWTADRFWKQDSDFYDDSTPAADAATVEAVKNLGTPQYGGTPDASLPPAEWQRAFAEHQAFEYLADPGALYGTGVDDARMFLSSGGFARTAPEPGTAEYRIAVEDLKSRYAACTWRDPLDPSKVLGPVNETAAQEWQSEIAGQATQRNQILNANTTATKALAEGAKILGDLLGHSWTADHITQWQDYWFAGGIGRIGEAPTTVQVAASTGKCLDAKAGGTANGTVVQIYKCNNSGSQQWTVYGGNGRMQLRNPQSGKCVDVSGSGTADGTKIQLWTCNSSPAQDWVYNVRAKTVLKNVNSGKCVHVSSFNDSTPALLKTCGTASAQEFTIKLSGQTGTSPAGAQFDLAAKGLKETRAAAVSRLAALKSQAATAKQVAVTSATAEQAAYAVADAQGSPRGRGLLVGQQKAQVTQGAVAALEAMVKAGETAEAATRASVADSQTIGQRALAQAAQTKTEFRKKAAYVAEQQAKAAAAGAKIHRDNAKKDKEEAEAKLADALVAESDAKTAAANAHAKRLAAEAEEATAKKEKETAAAKRAETAGHRKTAEAEAVKAEEARKAAEGSESTAESKRDAAVTAKNNARDLREDAWDAEVKRDAARARADAKEAFAQAHESDEQAQASRAAADEADRHADGSEAAAGRARTAADAATKSAAEADAAATRAEAAAKRARANADAAQAEKEKADAAVRVGTRAVAEAIIASDHAAGEARQAVALADQAEEAAKTAKSHADEAAKEVLKARDAAAKSTGYAYVTAQAAADAGNSAAQVVKPANDAIQLGSPYVTTDSAAPLVVLTGQSSKTIAEQQKAVATAHAANAQQEAAQAQATADQAAADTKAAYQSAANAAKSAAEARGYAKEALEYSAGAAKAAAAAQASLARTKEYDRQAGEDAAAADKAAGRAEGHARDARAEADAAELDASAARDAAAKAEASAKAARAAADRADAAATEAEEAAKEAEQYAKEAQEAAERAERAGADRSRAEGAGTGIPGVFFVPDESTIEIVSSRQIGSCPGMPEAAMEGCNAKYDLIVTYEADFYLCTDDDAQAPPSACPKSAWQYLSRETINRAEIKGWTHHFSGNDIIRAGWQSLFGETAGNILFTFFAEDLMDCFHGDTTACLWSAATLLPVGGIIAPIARAVKALDAAVKTGIGFTDAWKALRALGLSEAAIAGIGAKALETAGKAGKGCVTLTGLRGSQHAASVASTSTCPSGMMVLGIQQHSDELAKLVDGGYTFNGTKYAEIVGRANGQPIALWMVEVSSILRNNGKVAVSLKGFDGATPAEQYGLAYKAWKSGDWRATQWEMGQIGLNVRMGNLKWSNVTFYGKDGKIVNIPEPDWKALNG